MIPDHIVFEGNQYLITDNPTQRRYFKTLLKNLIEVGILK